MLLRVQNLFEICLTEPYSGKSSLHLLLGLPSLLVTPSAFKTQFFRYLLQNHEV